MRFLKGLLFGVVFCLGATAVWAGDISGGGDPATAGGGAMNTLEDIYNLINEGTTNAPRSDAFHEPSSGPASTGHTLTEVYNRALTSSRPAETGQTTRYADYDDGYYKKGVSWPSTRWTCCDESKAAVDCETGSPVTAVDNLTGLQWVINANLLAGSRTWASALTSCNSLEHGGYYDWRLPNRYELESLLDMSQHDPALPLGHPFTGVVWGDYWSSSTYALSTGYAWRVSLQNGFVNVDGKTSTNYVWPVRGGQ